MSNKFSLDQKTVKGLLPFLRNHLYMLLTLNYNKEKDFEEWDMYHDKLKTCQSVVEQLVNGMISNENNVIIKNVIYENMICLIENHLEDLEDENKYEDCNVLRKLLSDLL